MWHLQKKILWAFFFCSIVTINIHAQGRNTISGHVFGEQRLPLEGISVELLDDYSRTISRVRTNAIGRYYFDRMPSGVYRIRVLPLGTNYLEQEQRVEIQNITGQDSSGQTIIRAYANELRDFYLRLDKDKQDLGMAETVFAQEVPEHAKQLYDEGIELLAKKENKEGYKKLIAAIEAFPDYYLATEQLGLHYVNANLFEAASILLQRAVQINPKSYKAWYGLAFAFSSLDINKEALDAAQQASTINPASPDAQLMTGRLLRRTGSYKDAEKHLINANKLAKETNPDIHWELALLYGKNLKRYKDAVAQLEAFLKLRPKSNDADNIRVLIKTYKEKATNNS
ncbi:MAG: tetratricopeptide repeat protein [Pyrinomonadaceae bacterium]